MRNSRLDAAAKNLIQYFQQRASRGYPEARRDWLYGPAHVPGGHWAMDELLSVVIRRAKDIGAEMVPAFELIYVYEKPPVWTCDPTMWVRDRAHVMELSREIGAQERWAAVAQDPVNAQVAAATVASLDAAMKMLEARSSSIVPSNDAVITRIVQQQI